MTDYLETSTKDGTIIRIEVDSGSKSSTGFGRVTPGSAAGEAAREAYTQVLDTIRACANGMIETVQNLDAAPSSASIDFAIKIDAEAGALVAKRMGEAQFKVSLSWQQAKPESSDEEKEPAE